jgi:hypothetical protein
MKEKHIRYLIQKIADETHYYEIQEDIAFTTRYRLFDKEDRLVGTIDMINAVDGVVSVSFNSSIAFKRIDIDEVKVNIPHMKIILSTMPIAPNIDTLKDIFKDFDFLDFDKLME